MSNGNEAAFGHGSPANGGEPGVSKREYFAGLAMQGVLANPALADNIEDASDVAEAAVLAADALLTALSKEV